MNRRQDELAAPTAPASPAAGLLIGGRRGGALIGATAVASAGLSLAAQVLVERALGVDGFAVWANLNALLLLFVPLACLGSNHLWLSTHARGELADRQGLLRMLRFYLGGLVIVMPVFLLVYRFQAPGLAQVAWPVVAVLFVASAAVVVMFPLFQLRAHAGWVAGWPLAQVALRAAVGAIAGLAAWQVDQVMAAWCAGLCLLVAVGSLGVAPTLARWWRQPDPRPGEHRAALLPPAAVFGASDMLDALDLKLIVPLAAAWYGAAETAAAGIVTVLLSAMVFLPHVLVSRILLPAVHREGLASPALRRLVRQLSVWGAAGLAPLAALLLVWGDALVALVAHGDYSGQAGPLRLTGLCLLPLCLSMLGAAPYMASADAGRLLRWRAEGLLVFAAGSALTLGHGLSALLVAMACGRLWLCARTYTGLRSAERQP